MNADGSVEGYDGKRQAASLLNPFQCFSRVEQDGALKTVRWKGCGQTGYRDDNQRLRDAKEHN